MTRRWLIRSLFIALAMTCVLVWVASYWRGVYAHYVGESDYRAECQRGRAVFEYLGRSKQPLYIWRITDFDPSPYVAWPYDRLADYAYFGFSYRHGRQLTNPPAFDPAIVTIPLWFPTLLSSGLLWLAWRKTRPKPRGFPVEVAAPKQGESKP